MNPLEARLEAAVDVAQRAGELTLHYFRTGVAVETKSDASPVTRADRETETLMVGELRHAFPEDACLGEEHGEVPGTSGYRWIVDPIDGTKSFVQGVPLYGVLIGLEDAEGEAVAGVIHIPALAETAAAARGLGCRLNGEPVRVSDVSTLADACVIVAGPECFETDDTRDARARICECVRLVRGWCDCYGHLLVATGRAEAALDPLMSVWDSAALKPVIEEAGGVFTDWGGKATIHGGSAVSTNAALRTTLRELL